MSQPGLEILDLIGLIYEASYDASQWVKVLEEIARHTNSSSAALVYRDNTYPKANFVYTWGISQDAYQAYMDRYINLDPFFELFIKHLNPGKVSADHLLTSSRDELRTMATEFHDNFMIPHNMYHIGGSPLLMEKERLAAIAIQRSQSLGPWSEEKLENLSCLTPHFIRAFRIHHEFTRLRTQESAVYAMLDQLVLGVVLLDGYSRPLHINDAAKALLKTHPAVTMKGDRVSATHFEDSRKLTELINRAADGDAGADDLPGGVIGLRHPDTRFPLLMMATPVADLTILHHTLPESARVALFMHDPESTTPVTPDDLATMFGLSQSEANIAVALTNGMSIGDIAQARRSSRETVRAQLKSVFRKTDTRGQADLVRLLLTGLLGAVKR